MFGLIGAIAIGLIAGLIAKLIMPGRDPGGIIVTILLGMGGAVLFTVVGRAIHLYHHNQRAGLIGSIIGAIIILAIYRAVVARRPGV